MVGRDNIVTNDNYCYFLQSDVGRRVPPSTERGRASASNISPRAAAVWRITCQLGIRSERASAPDVLLLLLLLSPALTLQLAYPYRNSRRSLMKYCQRRRWTTGRRNSIMVFSRRRVEPTPGE